MSEDTFCLECDVYKQRCAELLPKLDKQIFETISLNTELKHLQKIYDLKCDEYKELILTNANLRMLLRDIGQEHDY